MIIKLTASQSKYWLVDFRLELLQAILFISV